jgi:flagellin
MRINTNVGAMNAANSLSRVQNAVSSSMEKLSSGFRINKAADDAAGLGIANKLRADGRALSQASRNAEQTNSLLQVAEGATSTIQSVLERMKELATQSGSDTVDAQGRASINAEFNALRSEIDRTVATTKFQGNALLDGTFGSTAPQLATSDITFAGSSTALAGSYTVSVSNAGVATLNRPAGAVPPTYTVDLVATPPSFGSGKASITFGSGTDAITVAASASSASDLSGIQAALDQHGFTVAARVASASSVGTTSVAGGGSIVIPSSVASGTLHFAAADAAITAGGTLAGSSFVSGLSIGAQQAADTYHLSVVSTDASINGTGNTLGGLSGISNVAVDPSQASGTYTVKFNGSDKLEVFKGAVSLGESAVLSDADVLAGGSFTIAGVSFDIDAAAFADKSALHTAIGAGGKGFTVDPEVRTIALKTSGNVTVGSVMDVSSFDGSADISFSQGGVSFTIDKSITFGNLVSQLNNKSFTSTAAHVDILDAGNAVLATKDLTTYSAGTDVTISQNGYQFTFAGSNAATDTYAELKSVANNAASTITVVHTAASAASATAVSGNGASGVNASFLVDASGSYKTNDLIQLQALNLSVSTLGLTSSDLSTAAGARTALSTIDSALGTVTTALGSIGANQNRISYAQENIKTKITNFSAAESVIRDVDMAEEMTKFSKNNILAQAGTAMLAQANQAGQGVLQLLRG